MKFNKEAVIKHFTAKRENGSGFLKSSEIRDQLTDNIAELAKELYDIRDGNVQLENGNKLKPRDISFGELIVEKYGCSKTVVNAKGELVHVPDVKGFLREFGIFSSSNTLNDMAGLGAASNQFSSGLALMNFLGNPMNTKDIPTDYRFIIKEIVADAIRTGYVHAAMCQNWILSSQNMVNETLVMPRIMTGNTMPSYVAEGADIDFGTLQFGKKSVKVRKIGKGFSITDELLSASSIDMVFEFLQNVGNDMAIGKDALALSVILNGEQSDLSESAPTIGTTTGVPSTVTLLDIDRPIERMNRLSRPVSRILTTETLKNADFNSTFANRERTKISTYTGLPVDVHAVPANSIVYLSGTKSMVELKHKSMLMERRRNIQNQTEEIFVSDWVGFAKVRRDAAVIQDLSVAYSATIDATGGFPNYMDIDARIAEAYKSF